METKEKGIRIVALTGEAIVIPESVFEAVKELLRKDDERNLLFFLKALGLGSSSVSLSAVARAGFETNKLFYYEGVSDVIKTVEKLYDGI